MDIGKRYIVKEVKGDDDTFMVGDHIWMDEDGDVYCTEAQGWIESCVVSEAMEGVVIEPDHEWTEQLKKKLLRELELLSA